MLLLATERATGAAFMGKTAADALPTVSDLAAPAYYALALAGNALPCCINQKVAGSAPQSHFWKKAYSGTPTELAKRAGNDARALCPREVTMCCW